MKEPGYTPKLAIDFLGFRDSLNRIDGRGAPLPDQPGGVFSETSRHFREPEVGDAREVRGSATRVASGELLALEQANFFSGSLQQIGGGEASDSAADHDDVISAVSADLGKTGKLNALPCRFGFHDTLRNSGPANFSIQSFFPATCGGDAYVPGRSIVS